MASDLLTKASNFVFSEQNGLPNKIFTMSVVVIMIIWYRWVFRNWNKKGVTPLPRGPRGLPLVGYLPFLDPQLHKGLANLARLYGSVFELRLGRKVCAVITSSTYAKEVLRDQDVSFANRDTTTAAMIASFDESDVVFSPNGPHWRKVRKVLVREMMSNTSLNASFALRMSEVHNTIREVSSRMGKAVDIGEIAFRTVLNTTMNSLWGGTIRTKERESLQTELKTVVTTLIGVLGKPNISDFFPAIARFDVQGIRRDMNKAVRWIERILESVIEERKKEMKKREFGEELLNTGKKDFLQILLELNERESDEASLTLKDMKALLLDMVVGATDTTTTMVEWTMAEIVRDPNVMKKVQEELKSVVGMGNDVEESHIPKLKYLDAVAKETFRLHPALPMLVPRRSGDSCTVGGYTVPKGATIFINVWAIQRDPMTWDAPLEFRPERFLNSEGKLDYSGNNFQYIPFGSGRRMCAGLPLGERMLMYTVASLMHSFDWKLPDEDKMLDMSDTFGIILKKTKPLMAIPTQRLANSKFHA